MKNELKMCCKKRGILLDYTIRHTPQHSGKLERRNRTLIVRARALLYNAKVQDNLWVEAVRTACYLLNRSYFETVRCTQNKKCDV